MSEPCLLSVVCQRKQAYFSMTARKRTCSTAGLILSGQAGGWAVTEVDGGIKKEPSESGSRAQGGSFGLKTWEVCFQDWRASPATLSVGQSNSLRDLSFK